MSKRHYSLVKRNMVQVGQEQMLKLNAERAFREFQGGIRLELELVHKPFSPETYLSWFTGFGRISNHCDLWWREPVACAIGENFGKAEPYYFAWMVSGGCLLPYADCMG
jgi:hypothetical protein